MNEGGEIRWCILRTSGSRTLALQRSLAIAGFDVWTPTLTQVRRRPRSKLTVEREMPITPTFVFARADHLPDMLRLFADPVSPHPQFSIFSHLGRVPLIRDQDIGSLRAAEEKAKVRVLKTKRRVFSPGTKVGTSEGGFAGLTGIVEGGNGKYASVNFGGGFIVKVATWQLRTDTVQSGHPGNGAAAQAA